MYALYKGNIMKSYINRFFIVIALTACSFSLITPMDPPKTSSTKSKELTWIHFIKKILLDQMPLQMESGAYALEDELGALDDGDHSFRYLNNDAQVNIVYFLKAYMTSGSQYEKKPVTLESTFFILKHLFLQNEHLKKLFFDSTFCRQLIKLLAKKFNVSELNVVETMKFGASHEILITQNHLLQLCTEENYPEKVFEKKLHQLIKNNNADVNFTYFDNETLLMAVVKTNHPSSVRPLIEAGADRSMKNKYGKTAKDILDEYWPEAAHALEPPLEYQIAFKELMKKKHR